jgi:hypothetical protein
MLQKRQRCLIRRFRAIACLALVALASGASAGDGPVVRGPTVLWKGVAADKFHVVIRLPSERKGAIGSMESVEQHTDVEIELASRVGNHVRFEVGQIGAVYEGDLDNTGTVLTGVLKQGDSSLPLKLVSEAAPPPSPHPSFSAEVDATGGRKCTAYLRVPKGADRLPLYVAQPGTGLYSTAEDASLGATANHVIETQRATVLTIDKPGVSLNDGELAVDDAVYNRYVTSDLVACVDHALAWASSLPQARYDGHIFYAGHSEGAQVGVRLLQRMVEEHSAFLPQLWLFILSGVPLEPGEQNLKTQLQGSEKLRASIEKALREKDDAALRRFGSVAAAWFQEDFAAVPCIDVLKKLAAEHVTVPIQVFQGLQDRNTSTDFVRDFERWNADQAAAGKPALAFLARYYDAPHHLNATSTQDIARLIDTAFRAEAASVAAPLAR